MNDKIMGKNYDPHSFEDRIYNTWESKGYFKADAKSEKEPYTIYVPFNYFIWNAPSFLYHTNLTNISSL